MGIISENNMMGLDAMSCASNYYQWIFDEFSPYIGNKIIEVGAGTGIFTNYLKSTNPELLYSIEPSPLLYSQLVKTEIEDIQKTGNNQRFFTRNNFLQDNIEELANKINTIIYISVLEHIEDDVQELKIANKFLEPNGHILIFVPSLQWLYGSHDKMVGHYRRYYKEQLIEKVEISGFKIKKVKYFDFIGIIPWWICFCLLKMTKLNTKQSKSYDKYAVPVIKFFEKIVSPVIGKNLILIAEKVE